MPTKQIQNPDHLSVQRVRLRHAHGGPGRLRNQRQGRLQTENGCPSPPASWGSPSNDAPADQVCSGSHGELAFSIHWFPLLYFTAASCFQPLIPRVCIAVYNHETISQRCPVLTAHLRAGCYRPSSYSRRLWGPEQPSHWSEITQLKTQPRSD